MCEKLFKFCTFCTRADANFATTVCEFAANLSCELADETMKQIETKQTVYDTNSSIKIT